MKKLIIFLMFILFISIVNADNDTIINETFNYDGLFINHGWSYSNSVCNPAFNNPDYPINSPFGSNGYSYNNTNLCEFSFIRAAFSSGFLEDDLWAFPYFSGSITIRYDYALLNDSTANAQGGILGFANSSSGGSNLINFEHHTGGAVDLSNPAANFTTDCGTQTGCEECYHHDLDSNNRTPYNITDNIIIFNIDAGTYSWYIDGSTGFNCEDRSYGDIGGIGLIRLMQGIDTGEYINVHFDNLLVTKGNASSTLGSSGCPFPQVFCDDFNYIVPLDNWITYDESFSVNNTFTPINNELLMNNTGSYNIFFHDTDPFTVNYPTQSGLSTTQSVNSPVFSTQFDMTVYNITTYDDIDDCLRYQSFDIADQGVYTLWFCGNESIYYLQNNAAQTHTSLCNGCLINDMTHSIKINTYFKNRAIYDFNSTNTNDETDVYVDSALVGTISGFVNNQSYNLNKYSFVKDRDMAAAVDNYFVMVGTDPITDTSENYFVPLFEEVIEEYTDAGNEGTGDMADAIATIWDDFGLKSTRSKLMTGIFLMFFLALIMFGTSLKTEMPLSPLILLGVEFFFMIFLIYIKLIPGWIGFVLIIISGGIAALMIKMAAG